MQAVITEKMMYHTSTASASPAGCKLGVAQKRDIVQSLS